MYFMSTACERPQGGGGQAHVNACARTGFSIFVWTS